MADSAAVGRLVAALHWLGHDSFRLDRPGGAIYFDPFRLAPGQSPAALILVSHDHGDHCDPASVAKLRRPDTVVVTVAEGAAKLGGARILHPGERLAVAGVTVEGVPAYNLDKAFHPRQNRWLGFLVTVDGATLYHAGDTDFIPEMAGLKPDVALLPVSGTYVMTAEEAVRAARALRPGLAVPMHYGTIVGGDDDARRFARALEGEIPVRILPREG